MFVSRSKGIHNHIDNIGLTEKGEISDNLSSIVDQYDARRASGIIVDLVNSNKFGGKVFLITGPKGCGKTALTVAISEELGNKIPFVNISGNDVYSSEVKKSEMLDEYLRKAVMVSIKEYKHIYEGEVVDIQDAKLDLRSSKGTKTLQLSKELKDQMIFQNVKVGDVVHIDSSSGIFKRMGRGESYLNDYDLEADKYVPLPKGDIYRKKEVVFNTTLHDLDVSSVNPTGQDVLSLVHQVVKNKKSEITEKLRQDIDGYVNNCNFAEVIYGVLLIEDANLLDIECFTYLNKIIDTGRGPTIILTSNNIEESNDNLYFGIPRQFLQKCLIIPINKNKNEFEVIKRRLAKENLQISDNGLKALENLTLNFGITYTVNIIKMLKGLGESITEKDIEKLTSIFKPN